MRSWLAVTIGLATGCGNGPAASPTDAPFTSLDGAPADGQEAPPYVWQLPAGFPIPATPADNPMSAAKAELGRYLFYDTRMSANGTQACASCHQQALAFTDGLAHAVGSTGVVNRHSAMSLVNVAYNSAETWANPVLTTLEQQALVPMFGDNPIELGLAGHESELLAALAADPTYPPLFAAAFPGQNDPISVANIVFAIASFERRIISGASSYDRYAAGDTTAISDAAVRGAGLFHDEVHECDHCHGTFAFTNSITWAGKSEPDLAYINTGLYNVDGAGAYPAGDQGLVEISLAAGDMGKFRAPGLRNIAMTAPYMHDGSIATLDDVIMGHYARGGRLITSGPDAGDGSLSPLKAALITGFTLNGTDLDDLVAFLTSLTDASLLSDPSLADPWPSH